MFSMFFQGTQQDWKLMVIAPIVCAIFRLAFIWVYAPDKGFKNCKEKWYECFRYGFWWGMDYNAYVFLISWLLISLPGAFFESYFAIGDSIRVIAITIYAAVLYFAFMGKMIFYYHFQDIYNPTMRLGKNADKKNFLDIFFHQNHGGWILAGYIPFLGFCAYFTTVLLNTPVFSYPQFHSTLAQYAFNIVFCIAMILLFYYFRYGGHISHRKKPEWDTVPDVVKKDMFFAKATVDDLVAIEMVMKRPVQTILGHTDSESVEIINPTIHFDKNESIWKPFLRQAKGAKITKPKHIFLVIGESYTQAPFDECYERLPLVEGGKAFRANPHTICVNNFLPAGMVSQPAVTSLIAGIFDDNLEINEKHEFWQGQTLTSLPRQLKRLGYKTVLWYGGSLSWASLGLFGKAMGFDEAFGGPDICPPGSPATWLGIYDHIFLESSFKQIAAMDNNSPIFHLVYTTSNHGPYTIPIEKYGFDPQVAMKDLPEEMRKNKALMADLGTYWYTDQALSKFVSDVQVAYPDSLIIVTGDHSRKIIPFGSPLYPQTGPMIREKYCTSFAMYHREFKPELFNQLHIGGHMNIMPTIIESIAPAGFEYYSMMPSFYEPISHVVTPYHWLSHDEVGYYGDELVQNLADRNSDIEQNKAKYQAERDTYCEVTGWIVRHADSCLEKLSRE